MYLNHLIPRHRVYLRSYSRAYFKAMPMFNCTSSSLPGHAIARALLLVTYYVHVWTCVYMPYLPIYVTRDNVRYIVYV